MFCRNCGKEIDDSSSVCEYCGNQAAHNTGNIISVQPRKTKKRIHKKLFKRVLAVFLIVILILTGVWVTLFIKNAETYKPYKQMFTALETYYYRDESTIIRLVMAIDNRNTPLQKIFNIYDKYYIEFSTTTFFLTEDGKYIEEIGKSDYEEKFCGYIHYDNNICTVVSDYQGDDVIAELKLDEENKVTEVTFTSEYNDNDYTYKLLSIVEQVEIYDMMTEYESYSLRKDGEVSESIKESFLQTTFKYSLISVDIEDFIDHMFSDYTIKVLPDREDENLYTINISGECYTYILADLPFTESGYINFDYDDSCGEIIDYSDPHELLTFYAAYQIDRGYYY